MQYFGNLVTKNNQKPSYENGMKCLKVKMLFDVIYLLISGIEKRGEQAIHVFEEDVKVLQRFKFQA